MLCDCAQGEGRFDAYIAALTETITGIAFDGVHPAVLYLFNDADMIRQTILPLVDAPVEENNHAGGWAQRCYLSTVLAP